jgi:hypothetical protein
MSRCRQLIRSGPPALRLGKGLTTPHHKKQLRKGLGFGWILCNNIGGEKWMRFGTWNVRSLYKACSLKTVSSELANYNLHLVAGQEQTV